MSLLLFNTHTQVLENHKKRLGNYELMHFRKSMYVVAITSISLIRWCDKYKCHVPFRYTNCYGTVMLIL